MNYIIKQIQQIISNGFMSVSDILALFAKFRILIEKEKLQLQYPILKLYCDWALHENIDRSKIGYKILEDISIMLYEYDKKNDYIEKVQEFISIAELRKQIVHLLNKYNLDFSFILNNDVWYKFFVILLFNHLIEKPIKLPKNSDKIYNEILSKVDNKKFYVVREFSFCIHEKRICWKLITENDYISIISPLAFDKDK